tara:strand:- start:602 stop:1063 length:462 start_codon:yes stop_codon:yes gene_type:complete
MKKIKAADRNEVFRGQISFLESLLEHKGYDVTYEKDAEDRVEFETRTIFINSRNHPENKFYTLLHEIGHILVGEDWPTFQADHPMYVHSPEGAPLDGRHERSHAYRVSLISEEIEAWKRGRRFANSLSLYIDNDKYDKHMTLNVMSYIEWAAR